MCCWWLGSGSDVVGHLTRITQWPGLFLRPVCYMVNHTLDYVRLWDQSTVEDAAYSEKWQNWHWRACGATELMFSMCRRCLCPPCFTHQRLSSWQLLLTFVSQLMRTHLGSDWSPLVNCSACKPGFLTNLCWASISINFFITYPPSCLTFWKSRL